jgi:hypothetical protein
MLSSSLSTVSLSNDLLVDVAKSDLRFDVIPLMGLLLYLLLMALFAGFLTSVGYLVCAL